ncbi:tetratricopeptide repeat protein [Pseudotamlana carrageenivorans]|uniref:tetratricopeptide repeat protein n=1 Tax=Pseudotamlana carrageenivorans TaxID=2069432 RepID=UPI00131561D2|nr:tetratricopeptide repeat protein [Tamlana carrageenivorans]
MSAQEQNLNCSYNIQEALFYLKGSSSVEKNTKKAIQYLKPCVSVGNIEAKLLLGHIYVNNTDNSIVKKGFKLIKEAAKEGNSLAAQKLGVLYKYGTGCNLNYQKAIKWFKKS